MRLLRQHNRVNDVNHAVRGHNVRPDDVRIVNLHSAVGGDG